MRVNSLLRVLSMFLLLAASVDKVMLKPFLTLPPYLFSTQQHVIMHVYAMG